MDALENKFRRNQIGVTLCKRLNRIQIVNILAYVTLIGNLFHTPRSHVSFHNYLWIHSGVAVRNGSIRVKNVNLSARVTSKSIRVHLPCHFQLCVSFRSHLWIQIAVTVRKKTNWSKTCVDLCDIDLYLLTLSFCIDITNNNGNYFCLDDTMRESLLKKVWQTNGQADGRTDRWTRPFT